MKKVVLLGDSIRLIGYGESVAKRLVCDGFEVWQPEDNSRFAQFMLRQIFDHREEIRGSDVVHLNAGAWDLCDLFGDGSFTDVKAYVETMRRIVRVLKGYGVKKIIFATTTPVRPESTYNSNETVKRFNETVVPVLQAEGCAINDLWSLVCPDIDRYIRDDTIHLSEEGTALCADAVYRCILSAVDR